MHSATPLEGALVEALREYDLDSRYFLERYARGPASHIVVVRGRRYDAFALGRRIAERIPDQSSAAPGQIEVILESTGLVLHAVDEWSVDSEREWRKDAWQELQRRDSVATPTWLRERGLYGGMQGVWVDAERTRALDDPGVAVAVRHTGRHYADDLGDERIIYSYPKTSRAGLRDANEIDAVRNAMRLRLPVFVLSDTSGGTHRRAQLAWVIADDPGSRTFLMEFADAEPRQIGEAEPSDDAPFHSEQPRSRSRQMVDHLDRDTTFKFRLLRRYRGACAITGVEVQEVLDGAHVIDVQHGGPDDVRNGLLVTADLHRAMDAMLWALDPETLRVRTRPQGPSLDDLQIESDRLRPGVPPPHQRALVWRYRRFLQAAKLPLDPANASAS